MPNTVPKQLVHVAVGVIRDQQGNILITRRPKHTHLGGLWEFPGGKLETGETVEQALCRELDEEVGIRVAKAAPLIKVRHEYDGFKQVLLDVWNVKAYTGTESAREGQMMRWVAPWRLNGMAFPDANLAIIKAVQLPDSYAILEGNSVAEVLDNCDHILQTGVRLLQLRIKALPSTDVSMVGELVLNRCRQKQVSLLVNSDLGLPVEGFDGVHLSSRALMASSLRLGGHAWVAASCHNLIELQHAEKLGVDFVVLAPVQATATHPEAGVLGWDGLKALIEHVNLPVFALGGLSLADRDKAVSSGAQGVAGISAFIEKP